VSPPLKKVRPARQLLKPCQAPLAIPVDPLVGCLSGDVEPLGQLRHGAAVQLVVFNESLLLLAHGNTAPGHRFHLFSQESVTYVLGICVTDVPVRITWHMRCPSNSANTN